MEEDTQISGRAKNPCAGEDEFITVELTGSETLLRQLGLLFSGGVGVDVVSGCTVRELLCGQLGITPDYLEGRLQTVFLNGKPVDDVDAARAGAGDMLALSAAMPGLVGATMRRGGRYAVLRQEISYTGEADCLLNAEPICLTLKLFNLIASELAPVLFQRGVWIDGDRLVGHMALMGAALIAEIQLAEVDGNPIVVEGLAPALRGARVRLRLQPA